jgi:phage portal protein BeeE
MPNYQSAEVLNQIYYSDCLQSIIEHFESCMDEGLGLWQSGRKLGIELDIDGLLRMDNATLIKTLTEGIKGAVYTPNEARKRADLKPIAGGDTVYMQQQNWSLEQLDRRDIVTDSQSVAPPPKPEEPEEAAEEEQVKLFLEFFAKGFGGPND